MSIVWLAWMWQCGRVECCACTADLGGQHVWQGDVLEVQFWGDCELSATESRCCSDCRHLLPTALRCVRLFCAAWCTQGITELILIVLEGNCFTTFAIALLTQVMTHTDASVFDSVRSVSWWLWDNGTAVICCLDSWTMQTPPVTRLTAPYHWH